MREVGTFEAKTHLSSLLEAVAAGEEVLITKRGIPVARLMPPEGASEARRRAAWRRIEALRADLGAQGWTPDKVLSARDEGRR